VVVVILDAGRWEVAVEGFEVFMSHARPSVQKQHLDSGVVPNALGPHTKGALGRVHRNQLRAAAERIITSGSVEIICTRVARLHGKLRVMAGGTLKLPRLERIPQELSRAAHDF